MSETVVDDGCARCHRAGGEGSPGGPALGASSAAPMVPTESEASTGPRDGGQSTGARRIERWQDWISLTKPRVTALLLLTALVAIVLAADGALPLSRVGFTLLGGYLCAGGASAINCYLDRDLDAQMARTRHRAIPSGRLKPTDALILGLVLALASGLILWVGTHPVAAVLALLAFGIYVLVYTLWLKRRSPWNVVVGGLAGAAPPLVGWAAATGTLAPTAFLLGAIVFVWTPAHFWTLALMRRTEYARAGVPMLPVVRGEGPTRRQILIYAGLTVALTAIPAVGGTMGPVYAVGAGALDGVLLALGVRMYRSVDGATDRRFYFFTLLYLGGLFLAMVVDRAAGL